MLLRSVNNNTDKWQKCIKKMAKIVEITRCWDCRIASKYLIIWLLKSLAFSF